MSNKLEKLSERELLEKQIKGLAHLAVQMNRLIQNTAPLSPDYKAALADFANYEWSTIGSEVVQSDNQGPVAVKFYQYIFTRRSGDGKYGEAIWFSRSTGKTDGENTYARLITFKGDGNYTAERIRFSL